MRWRLGVMQRYGIYLLGGYLALFLVLHSRPADPAPGIPTVQFSNYLEVTARLNPIQRLNEGLGAYQLAAVRLEMLLVLALLFVMYVRLLRLLQHLRPQATELRSILAGVLLFSLPLILLPHILAEDIFSYIMHERIAALYGGNPAIIAPSAFPQDPFLEYVVFWNNAPSVYGPFWTLVSHGLTVMVEASGGALWQYMSAYKLLALAAHLASTLLLWHILAHWCPTQQTWGTLLYAWNPLALLEFSGAAHNDALMVSLLLLGCWLAQHERWHGATVTLVGAALIKWVPVVLLALYGLLLLRQRSTWVARLALAVQFAVLVLGVIVLLYAPYGLGVREIATLITMPGTRQSAPANTMYTLALLSGVYLAGYLGLGPDPDTVRRLLIQMLGWIGRGLTVLIVGGAALTIWRRPSWERWVQSSFWVLFLILLVAAPYFWPWYVTWPLALAALLPWSPAGLLAVAFTASASINHVISQERGVPIAVWSGFRSLFIFLPVMLLLAYLLWHRRQRETRPLPSALPDTPAAQPHL